MHKYDGFHHNIAGEHFRLYKFIIPVNHHRKLHLVRSLNTIEDVCLCCSRDNFCAKLKIAFNINSVPIAPIEKNVL